MFLSPVGERSGEGEACNETRRQPSEQETCAAKAAPQNKRHGSFFAIAGSTV
jgi:hypothetical protein